MQFVALKLLIALILVQFFNSSESSTAFAGTLSFSERLNCDLYFDGDVETGDVERLEQVYKKLDFDHRIYARLCLNSKGGSYDVGLKIIGWLIETSNIYTVVEEGDECISACALIFMFGNHNEGDALTSPHRELHVGAKLGFHAPYIDPLVDSKQAVLSAKAYRAGIVAIGGLLEIDWDDWFPKSLLIAMLKREPNQFLFVDTIERAASWSIELTGFQSPNKVTRSMLEIACINAARTDDNKWSGRWWGAGDSPTGQREEILSANIYVTMNQRHNRTVFKGFGAEDGRICVTDVYEVGKNGLLLDVNFGDDVDDSSIPAPRNPENIFQDGETFWSEEPNWFFYPGLTKLADLPRR
ncbi:MAG: hypothetical protein AAGF28_07005 [Pseudomonadota bacterium]